MKYPTMEEVNEATRYQICEWWRFLPSPGSRGINRWTPSSFEFRDELAAEVIIMNRIAERFKELGGFTPEISKKLGWGR